MAGSIITTGSYAKRLWPGVKTWFGMDYDMWEGVFAQVYEMVKSDKRFEEEVNMSSAVMPTVKDEGAGTVYQGFNQSWVAKYDAIAYSTGFMVTREMQLDDQYASRIAEMCTKNIANKFKYLKEYLGANVINNGYVAQSTNNDKVCLFNSAHPLYAGGTASNIPAQAADLHEAAIEQACIDIRGYKDEAGLLMSVKPKMLLVHKNDEYNACRILNSDLQAYSANNATNALKDLGTFKSGHVVWDYLTDVNQWTIVTDCPNGFKHFENVKYDTKAETDFDTDNAKFKFYTRFSLGYTNWRCAYSSQGSS